LLGALFAFAADTPPNGESNIDINSFEEITPQIQEVDPAKEQAKPSLEEMQVKPIELGNEKMEFEEYRPAQAPKPPPPVVVKPAPAPAPQVVKQPAPAPAPAPIVAAPVQEPMDIAEPAPVQRAAPLAAPSTPVVRMVEQGPVLPPVSPAPLIPVEPPPERGKLRVPEEVQVAQSYRPDKLDLTVDENYDSELKDLQKQLALLRERVIETKSRIITYGERVSRGFTAGTRVVMKNENALGEDFLVESVTYYLDGHQVYSKKFDGENAMDASIYKGSILPGKHKVDMELVLRGDEGSLDFSHKAKLKYTTSEYFTANEGKQLNIKIRFFDKGGFFTKVEERPGISFEIAEEDAY
jgi:hypothetical protein